MPRVSSCRPQVERALSCIAPQIDRRHIDNLTLLIDSSMQGQTRHYHTLSHALLVADSDDVLDILIGLCHDIVQVDVDGGLPAAAEPWLAGLVRSDDRVHFTLVDDAQTRADQTFGIVKAIFNLQPGQLLPDFGGKNEFLSAMVACRILERAVDPSTIAALAVGIEATIPFRKDPDGIAQRTLGALEDIDRRYGIGFSNEQSRDYLRRSVRVANRDVGSFASENLPAFLDDTWNLMRESSADLRRDRPVKIDTYRLIIQKMTRFLGSLQAENVFRCFDDEPSAHQFPHILSSTSENLSIISAVMQTKLLAVALIETATADITTAHLSPRITSRSAAPRSITHARTVESILAIGKDSSAEFDIDRSPLSHRVISTMSAAEIKELTNEVSDRTPISKTLLTRVPAELAKQAKELVDLMITPCRDD
ncbi:MAG: hypothetical protein FJ196_01145 [Gammaproteobacteria bacterium]|nr:hypothetical protein [Gammaproteobacteria bacterium]